ncbi:MAG: pantoate--beta-alanine ligase [Chloroflexi bacterium]|nr:pantoate--beta-alanine ligase [Chloroflexota bacterium]
MQIASTVAEYRTLRAAAIAERPGPVGLVPTMGYLHDGHRSLMQRARAECATVVTTIFVNPTQFGPNEDFARYPRDEARDFAICEAERVDIIFAPSVEEMYPDGAETTVSVGPLSRILEGAARPGHFDGVATVVTKLFALAQADRGYFGQKDAQQLMVLRRLAEDLRFPIEVIGCPIVREPDGLALSSRNVYLSPEERTQALSLSRGLRAAEALWADGVRGAEALRRRVGEEIEAEPLANIDYVSLADQRSLQELAGPVVAPALLSLAVRFGPTRLIDNILLEP